MKKVLKLIVWLLALLPLAPTAARAQEGTAFSCDGTFYQIRQVGATSQLFRVDRSAATYTTVPVAVRTVNGAPTNDLGVLLNGLAYNSQDGYMYALSTTGTSNTLPTSIQMYKIGQGGITPLGTVTGIPNIQVAGGTIDKAGRYYVSSQNAAGTANYNLYQFNLASPTPLVATALRLRNAANTADANLTFYDLALNPKDGLLYGVFQNGTLWRIDPLTNAGTSQAPVTVLKATATTTDPVGTSFFDIAGNLFVYTNGATATPNSGKFYQVDLANGDYALISSIDPASVSDGASCINPDFYLDVVKQVTGLTRTASAEGTAGREYQATFRFKVKNTGTQTLQKVQVSDFLWSGAAGTQQLGSAFSANSATRASAVVVNSLTVTNDGNATLAANFGATATTTPYAGFSSTATPIQAGLLTGNQDMTAGQSATITLTVTVTYPNVASVPSTPAAPTTNQAYASALGGANTPNGGYRLGVTTGTLFSPANGNLQAVDNSTNDAALPPTPNADTPAPSPLLFPTTIAGNVFEDANYGGGAGRSKMASNGTGVTSARVELYSLVSGTYTFLSATTTNASGDYVFTTTNGTAALAPGTTYAVRVVNTSVVSKRPGSVNTLLAVQTFRTDASNASTQPVTDHVGGEQPSEADYGDVTSGALPTSAASPTQEVQSITNILTPASGPQANLDFGFNFDAVVNTNDAGQGSLRQFITNSNALTNAGLAQAGQTAGKEFALFMMNDGRTAGAPAGLRNNMTPPSGYSSATKVFTIASTTLPTITDSNTAIDGKLQTLVTGDNVPVSANTTGAEVAINFAGATRGGLLVTGASTRIASLELANAGTAANSRSLNTTGAVLSDGAAITFTGAGATGSVVTDVTGLNNTIATVLLQNGATGVTVDKNVLRTGRSVAATSTTNANDGDGILLSNASGNTITGNTITANNGFGIELTAASSGNTISGNTISGNGAGTATLKDAGIGIVSGNNNAIGRNTISSNAGNGIVALSGTSGNLFTQNSISLNTALGIDLSATAAITGDGATPNANGKTAASGANGLLNFPIIRQAVTTTSDGNSLQIRGYAPAGSTIEFFVADRATDAFGQGLTYLFTAVEGGTVNGINDRDASTGNYSGAINGQNQGSETNVPAYFFIVPLSSLPTAQAATLSSGSARLTATATSGSNATSEFSGNVLVKTNQMPLPVTLSAFEVQVVGANARLGWTTATELKNDHFVVERSLNGAPFEAIGKVAGSGTSSQTRRYGFVDANAGTRYPGTVYYRLQQVDADGTATASPVRSVSFAGALATGGLALYPNPTADAATLDLTALAPGAYQVTVIDATGRTLNSGSYAGGAAYPLAVQQAPAGTYFVLVRGQGVKLTKTLVKN